MKCENQTEAIKLEAIDWNKASELGLIERINTEVLHPLGLAMSRNPLTGHSESILVADDKLFTYDPNVKLKPKLTNVQIHQLLNKAI